MNQLFAGALAVTVAIFLLGIRRKPISALIRKSSDRPLNSNESLIAISIKQDLNDPKKKCLGKNWKKRVKRK